MLKPAQLYADELRVKILEGWYQPENIYWNGGPFDALPDLPKSNYNSHDFVSVDKTGAVIGFVCYEIDWAALSAKGFGAISFDKGNLIFGRDLYQVICNVFHVYHLNRLQWFCYADNPAIRSYRRFIQKHGGRECGYFRQTARLKDGKLHDGVHFEILADEFTP